MKGKLKTWKERNMTIFHDQEVTLGVLILAVIYFHESKKKKNFAGINFRELKKF